MELDTNSFTKPMNTHFWLPPSTHTMTLLIFLIITIFVPLSYCEEYENVYAQCGQTFQCGHLQGLSYPFFGSPNRSMECGQQGFELVCRENQSPNITINDQIFSVVAVNQSGYEMSIARTDLADGTCPQSSIFPDTTLNYSLFNQVTQGFQNLSIFYRCNIASTNQGLPQDIDTCAGFGNSYYATDQFLDQLSSQDRVECGETIKVPIPASVGPYAGGLSTGVEVLRLIRDGFNVSYQLGINENCWQCTYTKGICATNSTTSSFTCLCTDRAYPFMCPPQGNGLNWRNKLIVGVCTAVVCLTIMSIGFYIYQRRKRNQYIMSSSSYLTNSRSISSKFSQSRTDIEKGSKYYGVHVFTYEELEVATNYFDPSKELGDGGFGTVYYGKLRDGREVAVKRLYESNYKRVEQFMNEIDILARRHHRNLVSLYGCTSRHSRELILVYEYISNGTVADHLHGEKARPGSLPWSTRMNISVETASALAYLHASDIIHRDVKTNNILLDKNFSVKVADFGLSRLFPTDVTHVSTAPQGTPGYVDPEYHQCYQLTSKSDVYSFGVVLIELISSMPAVDITRHRHEINLSNMAINKIQSHALHELVDQNLGFRSDIAINRMISSVAELAFQCLQGDKDMRPSMTEVLDTLKAIQSRNQDSNKADEMEIPSDDVVLLKSGPLQLSPDSVTMKWISGSTDTSTTPHTSS